MLDMAQDKARESRCDRSKVGAVLILQNGRKFLACNEVSPGHGIHTCKDFCPRGAKSYAELPAGGEPYDDCNALHAEFAVIANAMESLRQGDVEDAMATHDEALLKFFAGSWIFSTKEPCDACKMYLQRLGIRYQWATSWQRRVIREGVLTIVNPSGEGSGNSSRPHGDEDAQNRE